MKKYAIAASVLSILAIFAVTASFLIAAPAKAAARYLNSINKLTVGKTTEAELLTREEFQIWPRMCSQADCYYHMEVENRLLHTLHLAPRIFFSVMVWVRNGLVTDVAAFYVKDGLPPLSIGQHLNLPAGCASNPCVKRMLPLSQKKESIRIVFNNESEVRNRMPEAFQSACLARLRGCNTYEELSPLTKELNLAAAQPARR